MFIKDLVMWCHYNVILENSDITNRPWQCLAISDNLNLLSAYVIWNILVLNIKGKVNKIAIQIFITLVAAFNDIVYIFYYKIHLKYCQNTDIGYKLGTTKFEMENIFYIALFSS